MAEVESEQGVRWRLVDLVGMKIGGDWSGSEFDGRDVKRWLELAHYGIIEQVRLLIGEMEDSEDNG